MPRDNVFLRLIRRPTAALGLGLLLLDLAAALLAPVIFPDDPMNMVAAPFLAPGQDAAFLFGTDHLGRNVLAQLLYGARISLIVGFCSAAAATLIGTIIGALAGYYGGLIDNVLMRITELFQTIPGFILAIVLVVIMGGSIATIIIAISIVAWPPIARIVRAEFLSLRSRDFVKSCVIIGMSDLRIIVTQMLPNCLAPIVVTGAIVVATAILTEAGLSFLGLGDPNVVSWGNMIGWGRTSLRTATYLTFIPGCAILLTVLAINLVGEGLNDALNPRLRER